VARDSTILNPQVDPAELNVPFWPLEMQERADRDTATGSAWTPSEAGAPKGGGRGTCPLCGSREIRPSSADEPFLRVKATYRCVACNASFQRVVRARLVSGVLLGMLALAGLISLAGLASGRRAPKSPPTLKGGQIPKPVPPVFR